MNANQAAARLQQVHAQRAPVTFLAELQKVESIYADTSEFLAHYKRIDCDFVFDKRSGLFFVSTTGDHVELLASLYWYHGGTETDKFAAADQFVLSSLGLFKSRAGSHIYRSYAFSVPGELNSLQRDIEVLL